MTRLIDVAQDVTSEHDPRWTSGLEFETLQCSLAARLTPLCLPAPAVPFTGSTAGTPTGFKADPFEVSVELRQPNMCRTKDPEKVVSDAVEAELNKGLARALWYGTGASDVWLGHESVQVAADLAEALQKFSDSTVGIAPVIHMGIGAALDASSAGQMSKGHLSAFEDIPVVISSSYPTDGIAVTGPIEYLRTQIETIQVHNVKINRETTMAAIIAAVQFDPCAAIVVGTATPDQVYVGQNGLNITVAVTGAAAAGSVAWGDTDTDTIDAGPDRVEVTHTYGSAGSYDIEITTESGTTSVTVDVA